MFSIASGCGQYRDWIRATLEEHWASAMVVARGKLHHADALPSFVAVREGEPVGVITYLVAGGECEIITLNSLKEGIGIGTALIEAVKRVARSAECHRLVLITTNDNMKAVRFFQKRGFRLVSVHRNALEASHKLKPEIPLIGIDGIPLRDEIELDLLLEE